MGRFGVSKMEADGNVKWGVSWDRNVDLFALASEAY